MGFFDRFRRRRGEPPTGPRPSAQTLRELEEFMRSREGVEAFVEPQTNLWGLTVILVAGDGEHMRRPIRDERQAKKVCAEHGVPIYDARIVGYPKRMRDFERGRPQAKISLDDLPPLEVTDERDD
jgi:hypothetical protein